MTTTQTPLGLTAPGPAVVAGAGGPRAPLPTPAPGVVVLVASLNEEENIVRTLRSLRAQTVRPQLLAIADSRSTDRTVELARPFVDVVYLTPRGKLTATDRAIRALPPGIHTIVTVDADTVYPPAWLGMLLEPLRDPMVVMSHGTRHFPPESPMNGSLTDLFVEHGNQFLIGNTLITAANNRAYRRWAYLAMGGFNLLTNEKSWPAMWVEEEVLFTQRMMSLGLVRFAEGASCGTSSRRLPGHREGARHAREVAAGFRF